jgi:hypothetical protein
MAGIMLPAIRAIGSMPAARAVSVAASAFFGYNKTRVAVPRSKALKWLFPQEKATSQTLKQGIFTLVLL